MCARYTNNSYRVNELLHYALVVIFLGGGWCLWVASVLVPHQQKQNRLQPIKWVNLVQLGSSSSSARKWPCMICFVIAVSILSMKVKCNKTLYIE